MSQQDTRVDFYVLADTAVSARLRFACRLTEKAYSLDNRVHAHVENAADARELDELLWTYRQGSFVPHHVLGAASDGDSPVTIGHGDDCDPHGDLLINLCTEIPAFFDRFGRIAEIIDGSDDHRQAGRERFGFYRDNGYAPATHRLEQADA